MTPRRKPDFGRRMGPTEAKMLLEQHARFHRNEAKVRKGEGAQRHNDLAEACEAGAAALADMKTRMKSDVQR